MIGDLDVEQRDPAYASRSRWIARPDARLLVVDVDQVKNMAIRDRILDTLAQTPLPTVALSTNPTDYPEGVPMIAGLHIGSELRRLRRVVTLPPVGFCGDLPAAPHFWRPVPVGLSRPGRGLKPHAGGGGEFGTAAARSAGSPLTPATWWPTSWREKRRRNPHPRVGG